MRQPYDKKTVSVQIRITKPYMNRIREVARRDCRTVSGIIRVLIERNLPEMEASLYRPDMPYSNYQNEDADQ